MPGSVVRPEGAHRDTHERRMAELTGRVAELEAIVAVVDAFAAAHAAYETMPSRPARGTSAAEVVAWEQRRLELERRCYRANRAWSALVHERAPLAGTGAA